MLVSKYFVFFIFYSFLGWIYESCFCTINEHSWQNRGFLYGPCVPIYGFGAIAVQILFIDLDIPILHTTKFYIFLVCAVGSFFLEYITSYVLEKLFHARWWDYSKMPLNLHGRVCLPFTCCFGIAGLVISQYVIPPIVHVGSFIPFPVYEIVALLLMMVLGMDIALTVSALTTFAKQFERVNEQINSQIAEKYILLETNVVEKKNAGLEKLEEGKEAIGKKTELTVEKFNELREQLTAEAISKTLANASWSQRTQLKHITTYTHPVNNIKKLMEHASSKVKKNK